MQALREIAVTDPDLTLHAAADLLGVHYMTVYRYVRLGCCRPTSTGARGGSAAMTSTRSAPARCPPSTVTARTMSPESTSAVTIEEMELAAPPSTTRPRAGAGHHGPSGSRPGSSPATRGCVGVIEASLAAGAGRAPCCAPSPAFTASTMPASPKAPSRFKGRAHREPAAARDHRSAGIALVPERDKVFPNLTVAENLLVPVAPASPATSAAAARRRCCHFFPRLAELRHRIAGCCRAASGRCWRIASALVCHPELLLVDELSLGLAPVVVEDLMRAAGGDPRELGITVLLVEQSAAVALRDRRLRLRAGKRPRRARRQRRAPARPPRHPGILSRPGARRAPQLPRREAISAQPEVVWLSWRSRP